MSAEHETFHHETGFVLGDDPARLDIDFVLDVLATMYWAKDEPRALLRKAIGRSHAYGLYALDGAPAGFMRVLSDGVYNARLSDLFVLREHRGRGLGHWMMSTLLDVSQFRDVRAWQLRTDDMHGLYELFGFRVAEVDDKFMTMRRPASHRA